MLLDLHAHFAMHLLPAEQQHTHARMLDFSRRRWQAKIVALISRLANYQGPGDTPSVTEDLMQEGDVGALLSPLYAPFDEIDIDKPYGAPPDRGYTDDIVAQLEMVEDHVSGHPDKIGVARTPAELDALIASGRIALIHAIEGGVFLGPDEQTIRQNVQDLASRGVAYVTIAHLFWRALATNAPAIPFLPDWLYNLVFSQPDVGLSPLGEAAVQAMLDHGILIDITHMRERTIKDTFALLDRRAPGRLIPVIATHMACRLGKLEYCFTDETIREVARRGGVLGLIMCEHFITDGLKAVRTYDDSFGALRTHIDHIHDLTGNYDAIGIGSDLDGYIKPALPGLTHEGRMRMLTNSLRDSYGPEAADAISSGNALRVLRSAWTVGQPPVAPPPP